MKNLKRIASLVLAFVMLFSFATVSNAATDLFTDVAGTDKYADAIELLAGLGIIEGYEDGSFKPNGTITRAEAATIIVRTLGLDDNVRKGETIFSDMDASHWASGYVNIAVNQGIINGFPDGTFKPEDTLTYEQIVKMVVCAIGHELKATHYGTYPDGYLRAASDAGVTKGLSGSIGQAARRGLVAQLIYNALEVEMMDATGFSTGIVGTTYSYNGKTLLTDYLNIEKVDAVVTDTYLAGEDYSDRHRDITLDITKVYGVDGRVTYPRYEEGDSFSFEEGEYVNATLYLGYAVTAYVGEDENTGDDTIFAITLKDSRTDVIEILQDNFFAEKSDEDVLVYAKSVTSRYTTELDLDRNVIIVVNGMIVEDAITDYFEDFDVMEVVNNDKDKEYDVVFISVFDESEGVEFLVTEIDEDDDYWYFEGEDGELELDYNDDSVIFTIIRDGEIIDASDIEINDVITCLDASRSILTVYVSDRTVRGEIEEADYTENDYYINGKAYKLSPAFAYDLQAGDEGTFYLNYQGKIAYSTVKSTVTSGDYIFITNYDTSTKFSKTTYLIQAIDADGNVETYTLKNKGMKYITANGTLTKRADASDVYSYLTRTYTSLSGEYGVAGYVGLARAKASSAGVISELYIPGSYEEFYEQTKYAYPNNREYNSKRGTYGNYDLETNTLVFRVDDSEDDLLDAVEVGTVGRMFTDGDNYTFIAYGERGEDIEALVVTDGLSATNYQNHAIIVTKVSTIAVNGERTTKITGLQAGKSVAYTIDPDENFDVEVGNIILVSCNGYGYVDDLGIVANTTDDADDLYTAFEDIDVPSDEDAGVYGGMVDNKTNKKFTIEGIDEAFYHDSTVAYTLIDYTGRAATYKSSNFSAIKTTSSTASFVVVRTYEDEVIDVFIFRVDADEIDVPSTDIWNNITIVEPTEKETEAPTLVVPTEPETEAPTAAPTEKETEAPTVAPTEKETEAPTVAPTEKETEAPTVAPTEKETEAPTAAPTEKETEAPTVAPTEKETEAPTVAPTEKETEAPTVAPTEKETEAPTVAPTEKETEAPTAAPTEKETEAPTVAPTEKETEAPTAAPTEKETEAPTVAPTEKETEAPTVAPTEKETEAPTVAPTEKETEAPTVAPTEKETEAPTVAPTEKETEDGPILAEKPVEKKVTVKTVLANEVLTLINAERIKAGLPALKLDTAVTKVSEAHCIDMATKGYLDQKNKEGLTLQARLAAAKVSFTMAAENLAKGKYTSKVIVDAWMKSEKHKVNILSKDFTKVGISVVEALDGNIYWTVDFIK